MNSKHKIESNGLAGIFESTIVRSNARISNVSVFSDMIWDRREYADSRTSWKGSVIHWSSFFDRFGTTHGHVVTSLKEFAYALLFDPIEDDVQKETKTVLNIVHSLTNFLEYLQEIGVTNMADLTCEETDDKYISWLLRRRSVSKNKKDDEEVLALMWARLRVMAVQQYYLYSKRVSQPLLVYPLQGLGLFTHLGTIRYPRRGENRTPIIPKVVWNQLLGAALDYVEIYSSDILHAQKLMEEIRFKDFSLRNDHLKRNGDRYRRQIFDPVARNISSEFALNPRSGLPWRTGWADAVELKKETRALYDACVVVIGALSAMRVSELSLIQVDGFWHQTSDGNVQRYQVRSWVVKGPNKSEGIWEINEPAYKACMVMKALTAYARKVVPQKELFIQAWDTSYTLPFREDVSFTRNGRHVGITSILPVGPNSFTRYLRRFAKHINEELDKEYELPLVEGKQWTLVMPMLRRSLAGRIAREPFGIIAGMLHYKHVKVTTFCGYAGSDPDWLDELHDEEIAASEEFAKEIGEDIESGMLAGAKGEELVRDFRGMAGELKKNALKYFLESTRGNIHVGLFNYCVFQKDRALCLQNAAPKIDSTPILNACHPERCANSCVTTKHLPQWEVQINDAQSMLSHPQVTELQRIALSKDLEKAVRILTLLKQGS